MLSCCFAFVYGSDSQLESQGQVLSFGAGIVCDFRVCFLALRENLSVKGLRARRGLSVRSRTTAASGRRFRLPHSHKAGKATYDQG